MSTTSDSCWRSIGVYGGNHSCPQLRVDIHCRNCLVFKRAARRLLEREIEPLPPLSSATQRKADVEERSVLCFRLGREWLGLRCDRIGEVAPAQTPRRIAHRADGAIEGLVAVRGELHLSVALIEVLSLGQRSDIGGEKERLLLLTPENSPPIAFRASEVVGLRPIRMAEMEEVPMSLPPTLSRCLQGVLPFDTGRMAMLDETALLQALDEAVYR